MVHHPFFDEIEKFSFKRKSKYSLKNLSKLGSVDTSRLLKIKEKAWEMRSTHRFWSAFLFFGVVSVFFFVFIAKAFTVQIIKRESYLALARNNQKKEIFIQPERGVIYDVNGNVLVRNKPAFGVELNTSTCKTEDENVRFCKELVKKIGDYVKVNYQRVYTEIDEKRSNIIVASALTRDEILPLEANLKYYPGLVITTQPQRDYVYSDAFAHVLGYVGYGDTDYPSIAGKSGLEKYYDLYLSGISGIKIVETNSLGEDSLVLAEKNPQPGKNITTYLDYRIQGKAYELLKKSVDDKKATAGVAVAQDPANGAIIALVSYPAFDPNRLSVDMSTEEFKSLVSGTNFPFYNRAISAAYPPGSTFKMVTASAALMDKVVAEYTTIVDPGYVQIGIYVYKNWDTSGSGEVNIRRALQISNDTFFYIVGGGYGGIKGIGIERLAYWAKRFGAGSKTGIDLGGEVDGFMPDGTERAWYQGDTFITAIGQGDVLMTPVQLNNITTYFANGGILFVPKIVKSIDGVGKIPIGVVGRDFVSKKNYEIVRDGLKKAAESGGTAYPLFDFPIRHKGIELAGKTGTAQYVAADGKEKTHAWFTTFGPFNNPNISLTVFLEGGGSGATDAVPIARDLLDLWFVKSSFDGSANL